MKELILGFIGMLLGGRLMAQSLSQWFGQNNTQIRELEGQIAALREFAATLEEGYAATGSRLDTIGATKRDDLRLHTGYFASLKQVKPVVSSDPRVKTILLLGDEDDVHWLYDLLNEGELQLEDAERLGLIDELYLQVKEKFIKNRAS
jgi:hypothetical protein